jgi:hypothetical protein
MLSSGLSNGECIRVERFLRNGKTKLLRMLVGGLSGVSSFGCLSSRLQLLTVHLGIHPTGFFVVKVRTVDTDGVALPVGQARLIRIPEEETF